MPELTNVGKHRVDVKKIRVNSISKADYKLVERIKNTMRADTFKLDILADKDLIFFDSAFHDASKLQTQDLYLRKIIETAENTNKICLKLHPSSDKTQYVEHKLSIIDNIPFEIVALNNSLNNKILISIFSSACFTPTLLFGETPIIVILYKLFSKEHEIDNNVLQFIEKFKERYPNGKFYLPENNDELVEIIKDLFCTHNKSQ